MPKVRGSIAAGCVFIALLWATPARAQLIVGNNAAFGGGPITTYDFATGAAVASFVPDGAFDSNNGRGLLVLGNFVYYTELSNLNGPTDFIRIAPFNGGAGGADVGTLPNPRPGVGIQDLSFRNGVLYVLTGYPAAPLQVFGLNPATGAVISGPVNIAGPAVPESDGFVVLPNGNFLINSGDVVPPSCTYNQYNPATGALIPGTTINVPGATLACTGVDTDGTSLYFQTGFSSFTKTTLAGALVANSIVGAEAVEDISLVQLFFPGGTPGAANCHGKVISTLAQQYGGISNAATTLGYSSVADLQDAVRTFCGQ